MGKYIVTSGQNLYDIALHIYGSIEGIVDLMMHNTGLSLSGKLNAGQELLYTDNYVIDASIVAYNRMNNIIPANGERNVYYKEPAFPRLLDLHLKNDVTSARIALSGQGTVDIDWGDNMPLERIGLTGNPEAVTHSFDNKIPGVREIRIYGSEVLFRTMDLSGLKPDRIYAFSIFTVEKLLLRHISADLGFIRLTAGAYDLDLSGSAIGSLLPLTCCKDLMRLDLAGCRITAGELDRYLISLAMDYHGRRNCSVTLSQMPSGIYREPGRGSNNNYIPATGMEAVWLLVNEPAWNEAGKWKFIINDKIYLKQ